MRPICNCGCGTNMDVLERLDTGLMSQLWAACSLHHKQHKGQFNSEKLLILWMVFQAASFRLVTGWWSTDMRIL